MDQRMISRASNLYYSRLSFPTPSSTSSRRYFKGPVALSMLGRPVGSFASSLALGRIDCRTLLAASALSLLLAPRCGALAKMSSSGGDLPSDVKSLVSNVLKVWRLLSWRTSPRVAAAPVRALFAQLLRGCEGRSAAAKLERALQSPIWFSKHAAAGVLAALLLSISLPCMVCSFMSCLHYLAAAQQ